MTGVQTCALPISDFYLAQEYLPEVDERVLAYRRLASATELASVDALQGELEEARGALPLAGKNLFDRVRVRIRAERLGVTSVSLVGGRLVFQGLELTRQQVAMLKERRGIYQVKSKRLSYPLNVAKEELLSVARGVLEDVGGDDVSDEAA